MRKSTELYGRSEGGCVVKAPHSIGPNDCWRACVAGILEMPTPQVPNFAHEHPDSYFEETRDWLASRGWAIFWKWYGSKDWPLDRLVRWLGDRGPGVAFIVTGTIKDDGHAIVVLDGKIYDPSNCGISGPHPCESEGCDCGGYWMVYVITPRHEVPA